MTFEGYETGGFYDELFHADGTPRPEARPLVERIERLAEGELARSQQAAARALLLRMGITFNVYDDGHGTERIFPFDVIPRIVSRGAWHEIERGLLQRITALNHFIDDAITTAASSPTAWCRPTWCRPRRGIVPSASVSTPRAASGATSPAPTSSATATARSTCSRTICALRPASPTCWRTGRS